MKDSAPLVSIIIVNWNGKHWLEDCLTYLSQVSHQRVQIIVVDNASTDGSPQWMRSAYPKATLVINSKNLGFAEANNIGYKKAKGEYILFLNNDTKVKPDFITEFLKYFRSDRTVGGAQSKIVLMMDPKRLDSIGAFLTPTGFLFHNHLGEKDHKSLDRGINLYTAKGASMMFRRDVLRRVEVNGRIFDPEYFAYFEESDLCHRIWLAGFRIVYAYSSVIYHNLGSTSVKLPSAWVQYNSYKNRINSYIKNFGLLNLIALLPVHLLLCHVLAFVFLAKGNPAWFIAIVRAIWWNIMHLPRTLKNRKIVQETIRIRPDSAFFAQIMKFPGVAHYTGFLSMFLKIYNH